VLFRLAREMEAEERAKMDALYAPPAPAEPESKWQDMGDGTSVLEIEPRKGARMIHGIASSSTINSHGYALIAHGMDAALPVPILSEHKGRVPLGEVFYIRRTHKRIYVRAQLFDNEAADHAWHLILHGEVRCFSGAAKQRTWKLQGIVDGKSFYDRWELDEVTICRSGANPDSVFEIYQPGKTGQKFWGTSKHERAEVDLAYKGVWAAGADYHAGQLVTHGGALWHAERGSTGAKPGEAPGVWKLAVKRGDADRLRVPA
jgi:hypothetical protein